jgi:hypothetical protein
MHKNYYYVVVFQLTLMLLALLNKPHHVFSFQLSCYSTAAATVFVLNEVPSLKQNNKITSEPNR